VPTGCALLVWLAASDSAPPQFVVGASTQAAEWAPHLIGDASTLPTDLAAALPVDLPRAAWSAQASEVALGQGLLGCAAEPGRAGRFELLIQRAGRQVRALRGQRLWVAVELFGDGRASPELVALRAWAGRFSYRDHYLPALYHERQFGSDADQVGTASGADFLDRFLAIFEGLFTDIEGRIAAAALVTDAIACPADALPWLAGWVGLGLEPGLAPERRRLMLADAATLARQRGTLAGLKRALDLVSGGAVTRGQVVVVENFRLRRTLATLLGVQFADASDPLTAGISQSGNSVVGDTLFLGDPKSLDEGALKTFLALFRHLAPADAADAATLQADRAAAQRALYDDLAHRVTVLIHDRLPGDDAALVRRVADHAAPAHVVVSVVEADYPFMVGIASLIGADTYLSAKPTPQPVRVGPGDPTSALGGVDSLRGEGSLDAWAGAFEGVLPRADDRSPPPLARASLLGGADAVDNSKPFVLDGSASSAADGQVITLYTWTHLPDS
jgi:phage tail-like protein